jgi:alcohol dehydrogenase
VPTFQTARRILIGPGVLDELPREIRELQCRRALVVTDPGVFSAGIASRVIDELAKNCLEVEVFDGIEGEPTLEVAEACLATARAFSTEIVVGAGGGSCIDVAKVAAAFFRSEGSVRDYTSSDLALKEGLPLVAIPTTAGTGSEATGIAILIDSLENRKIGMTSPMLFPHLAVVDPDLMLTVPAPVTAYTGIDALTHAVEAYLSINATSVTDALAIKAVSLIGNALRVCFQDGRNREARHAMAEGSLLAGMAFANAGVAAVHAFAYPLGARYRVPHGVANALMLLPVFNFNMQVCVDRASHIGDALGAAPEIVTGEMGAKRTLQALETLLRELGIPQTLKEVGVREADLPDMAGEALRIERLLRNNPREIGFEEAIALYVQAFSGFAPPVFTV